MLCMPNWVEIGPMVLENFPIKRKMRNVCMITCADQIVRVWNLKKRLSNQHDTIEIRRIV